MPLTRYDIRNEYILADLELYKSADKNDPEALLEGVAMAGLVGVLRQLGDLAEFAVEIFHGLHEEVMAISARGHALMIRVQQVEAEFPSVEKALLSQTSFLPFLRNAGFEWHPKLRNEQNLVTQGELPRFVMESYEECRGPPRLFLLDKFDISGAGTCLKRYSDPSFFRVQLASSGVAKKDVKKEKRNRRNKKKTLWRDGETPEIPLASHFKLEQLLMEERKQSENNVSMHRARLKRRQSNSVILHSTTGKNYMERFLERRSFEGTTGFVSSASLQLKMELSNSSKPVPKLHDHAIYAADTVPFHSTTVLESSSSKWETQGSTEEILNKIPNAALDVELQNVTFPTYNIDYHTESEIDGDGCRSDENRSETENYMDALTTIDSETDTENRRKIEQSLFDTKMKDVGANTNGEREDVHTQFSGFHSDQSSIVSDDGSSSFGQESLSISYYETKKKLNENPSTEKFYEESFDTACNIISENGDVAKTRSRQHVITNGICKEESEIPSYASDYEEAPCTSCVTDSTMAMSHKSPGESTKAVNERLLPNAGKNGRDVATDSPHVESLGHGTVEVSDVFMSDTSSALKHPTGILDLVRGISSEDGICSSKETVSTKDAEDTFDSNTTEGEFDFKRSVASTAETHLNREDVEHSAIIETQDSIGHETDYFQSSVDCQDSDDYEEPKFLETAGEFSPEDLNSADFGHACSKMETICNNQEGLSGLIDCKAKDESALDNVEQNIQMVETVDLVSVMGSNHLKELENPPEIGSADYNTETCNPDMASSDDLRLSNGDHDPSSVEYTGKQSHTDTFPGWDERESESSQNAQSPLPEYKEIKNSVSNQDPVHEGATLEPDFESEAYCDSVGTSYEVGAVPKLSSHQFDNADFPDFTDRDPSKSSSVDEMPPLPPFPPVQWIMGKLRDDSLPSEEFTGQSNLHPFLTLSSLRTDVDAQGESELSDGDIAPSLNSSLSLPTTDHEKSHFSLIPDPTIVSVARDENNASLTAGVNAESYKISNGDLAKSLNPFLPLPTAEDEKSYFSLNPEFKLLPPAGDEEIQRPINMEQEITDLLNSFAPLQVRQDDIYCQGPLFSEGDSQTSSNPFVTSFDADTHAQAFYKLAPLTSREENTQPMALEKVIYRHGFSTPEETAWQYSSMVYIPTVEDLKRNGTLKARLALPRDPLIMQVASHDKSMLRKVPELVRPLAGTKVNERDSLLEQIRTKSFNLKPATLKRPNVQGPRTNFKVAAILEKANAIRQALAGSDDDDEDEDSWSDA